MRLAARLASLSPHQFLIGGRLRHGNAAQQRMCALGLRLALQHDEVELERGVARRLLAGLVADSLRKLEHAIALAQACQHLVHAVLEVERFELARAARSQPRPLERVKPGGQVIRDDAGPGGG